MRYWLNDDLANEKFERPPCLVDPIIPLGGIVLLYGKQTSGKSQLALTLALNVVRGEPFLGLYKVDQGPAVFVQLDMMETVVQDRIIRVVDLAHKRPLAHVIENSYIHVPNVAKSPPEAILAAQKLNPSLVIVDSLRKCHRFDEDKSATTAEVYGSWRNLFPTSTLLFIHHDGKDQLGPFQKPKTDKFRGSGAWIDDADTGLHLQRHRRERDHRAKLEFTKIRTSLPQESLELVMDPTTLLMHLAKPPLEVLIDSFLASRPEATKSEVVSFLLEQKTPEGSPLTSRSAAFRALQKRETEVGLVPGGGTEQSVEQQ